MRTIWLGLVGDGPSGRRNYDKPADEHLPADRVGTNVDKYGKVSSIGFAWRPIVAILNSTTDAIPLDQSTVWWFNSAEQRRSISAKR